MSEAVSLPTDQLRQEVTTERQFLRYPEYRRTHISWAKSCPKEWSELALKRLFRIENGSTPKSSEASYWNGDIPWATPDDLGALGQVAIARTRRYITRDGYNGCGTSLVPPGSILVSTRAPIGHLAIAAVPICTNQGCRSLVPRTTSVDSRYFYYQLIIARQELKALGQGSTFRELGSSQLRDIRVISPPAHEQRTIITFLDRETKKIDELIATKQRLIELLQEKRMALISQAVTKGLDPNVEMKDSGHPVLGAIPTPWSATRPKFICTHIVDGVHHTPDYIDEGVPFVTVKNLTAGGGISFEDTKLISPTDHYEFCKRAHPERGDILLTKDGTLGVPRVVETDREFSIFVSVALLKIRRELIDPYFLKYAFESEVVVAQFSARQLGSALKHLHLEEISTISVPLPPRNEQKRIVAWLRDETKQLEDLTNRVNDGVDRLREYRSALISAAVTGQIDVRSQRREESRSPETRSAGY